MTLAVDEKCKLLIKSIFLNLSVSMFKKNLKNKVINVQKVFFDNNQLRHLTVV